MATFHVVQEGPVNALALNRDNTQVAIGGRNGNKLLTKKKTTIKPPQKISVFKVYTIEEDKFREVCNLRASKHLNLSFSCNDVSWSWTDGTKHNHNNHMLMLNFRPLPGHSRHKWPRVCLESHQNG